MRARAAEIPPGPFTMRDMVQCLVVGVLDTAPNLPTAGVILVVRGMIRQQYEAGLWRQS